MTEKKGSIKSKLEYHYSYFDYSQISPDPLEFPQKFSHPLDIEISAFISSIFAYGNILQIMRTLEKIHSILNWQPYNFVINFSHRKNEKLFDGVKHRFYSNEDIEKLFFLLNRIYTSEGNLKQFFLSEWKKELRIKSAISGFSKKIMKLSGRSNNLSHGIKFMLPDPEKGSACKRMNLFLRWMVRKDELDFGLWSEIPTSHLIIPVDVHVARICRQLKLTGMKNVSWKMAEEITNNLKKFDPVDPVKYDFAICHIGMRKMKF